MFRRERDPVEPRTAAEVGDTPVPTEMTVIRAAMMLPVMPPPSHHINVVDALVDVGTPPGAGMIDETRR